MTTTPHPPGVDLLIATIGQQDPETDGGPTGPLRAALELRPRSVALLVLPGVGENARATAGRIHSTVPGATVQLHDVAEADPVDLNELIAAIDRRVTAFLPHGPQTVAVCATSGTPQLSLATTLVLMARCPAAVHYQALNPARADPPLLRPFDPDALRHHAETEQAFHALQACRFAEAEFLLTRRLESPVVTSGARAALEVALSLAQGLAAAAGLDPDGANRAIGARQRPGSPTGDLSAWYRRLTRSRKNNPEWPVELAALALRQQTAGLPAPAILTAATASEVALSVRLLQAHGIDAAALHTEAIASLPKEVHDRIRGDDVKRLEGAENLSLALRLLDVGYGKFLLLHDNARRCLLNARNKLIHAGKKPANDTVESALSFLDNLCAAFDWPIPSECPSSPANIARLVTALRPRAGLANTT